METVSAKKLMRHIAANANNQSLTDAQFRNSVGICQEVIEWREAMSKLGKNYSDLFGLRPAVAPVKVKLSSAYGEFGANVAKASYELDSLTQRCKVTAVIQSSPEDEKYQS